MRDSCCELSNRALLKLIDSLDFCAECLDSFIRDSLGRTDEDAKLPLGFTVSDIRHRELDKLIFCSSRTLARELSHRI